MYAKPVVEVVNFADVEIVLNPGASGVEVIDTTMPDGGDEE